MSCEKEARVVSLELATAVVVDEAEGAQTMGTCHVGGI